MFSPVLSSHQSHSFSFVVFAELVPAIFLTDFRFLGYRAAFLICMPDVCPYRYTNGCASHSGQSDFARAAPGGGGQSEGEGDRGQAGYVPHAV